jgi:hypothetical protein
MTAAADNAPRRSKPMCVACASEHKACKCAVAVPVGVYNVCGVDDVLSQNNRRNSEKNPSHSA